MCKPPTILDQHKQAAIKLREPLREEGIRHKKDGGCRRTYKGFCYLLGCYASKCGERELSWYFLGYGEQKKGYARRYLTTDFIEVIVYYLSITEQTHGNMKPICFIAELQMALRVTKRSPIPI